MLRGIDLSYAQLNVNWDVLVHQAIDFVYVKAAEGMHTIDTMKSSHSHGAKSCGLKLGYYYFAHPGKCDAVSSAQFFKANLNGLPDPDLLYALDVEVNDNNISPAAMLQWINDFIAEFNMPIMIYGGPGFLNANLPVNHGLGKYPLWLAEYETTAKPTLYPKGWSNCAIWQYCGNGTVKGIQQQVDLSRCDALPFLSPNT